MNSIRPDTRLASPRREEEERRNPPHPGDIVVKPKGGRGEGDPTGYNINEFL